MKNSHPRKTTYEILSILTVFLNGVSVFLIRKDTKEKRLIEKKRGLKEKVKKKIERRGKIERKCRILA